VLDWCSALSLSGAMYYRKAMIRKILFLMFGLLLTAAASAGVYTWTDAQGRVHYSDKPVAGAQTLDIKTNPTDPTRIAAQQKQTDEQQAADAQEQQKTAEAAKVSEGDAKKREENCQKAHARLAAITGAQRPYRTQPDGERHYLSSEDIDQEIKDAEAGVGQWCGS
jgi:hypothetical protein